MQRDRQRDEWEWQQGWQARRHRPGQWERQQQREAREGASRVEWAAGYAAGWAAGFAAGSQPPPAYRPWVSVTSVKSTDLAQTSMPTSVTIGGEWWGFKPSSSTSLDASWVNPPQGGASTSLSLTNPHSGLTGGASASLVFTNPHGEPTGGADFGTPSSSTSLGASRVNPSQGGASNPLALANPHGDATGGLDSPSSSTSLGASRVNPPQGGASSPLALTNPLGDVTGGAFKSLFLTTTPTPTNDDVAIPCLRWQKTPRTPTFPPKSGQIPGTKSPTIGQRVPKTWENFSGTQDEERPQMSKSARERPREPTPHFSAFLGSQTAPKGGGKWWWNHRCLPRFLAGSREDLRCLGPRFLAGNRIGLAP